MKVLFHQKAFLKKCRSWQGKFCAFFLFLFLSSLPGYSQNSLLVKGKVTDESGKPVAGASIIVKGQPNGISTSSNGNFEINAAPNSTLVISSIGFATKEINVNGRSGIDIKLETNVSSLDQVIVVGYGTQKKSTLTGSVSTLNGKEVAETPVPNISNSIAGKMAGVSMRPNGGQPGSDNPDIHIRGIGTTGNNAPLIVVDGIIRSNINQIDPNTIESMSVLKDAAAVAPYGLGGANGVILITTKQGKIGSPQLTLNSYYGSQTPTYNYYPKLLNATQYMLLKNEAYLNDNSGVIPSGGELPFDTSIIANYSKLHSQNPDLYPNSNPKEYVTNWHAPMQKYDLQVSGGTEKTRYYAGLGYYKQNGVFAPMNYSRYNYNMNLETDVTNSTKVSLSLMGSIEKTNSVDPNESASGLFRSGYKFIPTRSIFYSNGLWGEFAGRSPVAILKSGGYLHNNNNTLLTNITLEQQLKFVKGLSAKIVFGYDPNQRTIKSWHRPYYFYAQDLNTDPPTYTKQISANEGGSPNYTWLSEEYQKNQNFTYQGFLNYHHAFGKSDVTGLFVADVRKNQYEMFNATRNNFAINIDELSLGSSDAADSRNDGSSATGSQIGYVYRLAYSYDNKYLFEASGRYDGHYYFAPGKRWGYFPAFSAAWRLSEENFFRKTFSFINDFKIRGSWGKSGNLAGSAYQYLNGYTLYGNAYAFGAGNMVQGSYIAQEANPNITWEVATKTDVGLTGALWNNLLTFEADYFHERRTGMLLPPAVSVPLEYGLTLAQENAGIMESHGFEFSLGTNHQLSNGIQLGFNGNFSYATNKMLQIFETSSTKDNPNRSRTGRAFNVPFGYHALGLFTTADDKNGDGIINSEDGYSVTQFGDLHPGDIKYADLSGPDGKPDGIIDANDETVIGHPIYPLITYGFTPSASWKGVDVSLFFQGSSMMSFDLNGTFQTLPFANNSSNTTTEYYDNRWTPSNQDAKYPRATQAPYANNTQTSDFWIINNGYLRLKTIMIGYTLPQSIIKSLRIHNVRFYVSGAKRINLQQA